MKVFFLSFAAGIAGAALALGLAKTNDADHSWLIRSDYELCQEVRAEVQRSVKLELLTQAEADQIVDRCFNLFAEGQ